jgi:sugar lactone lactonase YvrE
MIVVEMPPRPTTGPEDTMGSSRSSIRVCTILAAIAAIAASACGADEEMDWKDDVQALSLPGDRYYPESLTAAADGTLYVGSLGTGQVVKVSPGESTFTTFLAGGDPKGVAGLLVDDGSSTLFLCAVDLTTTPPTTEVRGYHLDDASLKNRYSFPEPAFCNDLALDGAGNLYISDSFGGIYKLLKGATTLSSWKRDPLLAPSSPTGFGADGLAVGRDVLYVNAFSDSRLVQIAINADGSAGALSAITVTPALEGPDGMRVVDGDALVVAEGASGRLTKVALSGSTGTATVLASSLDGPTSVARSGGSYWVSEGQLSHLLGGTTPVIPFSLERIRVK